MGTLSRKVGLALSGGGARGLARIGVLKILEQEGIPIMRGGGEMSLKTHLARLVANASLRQRMGEASRRLAEAHNLDAARQLAVGGAGNQRTRRARDVGTYHLMTFEEEGAVCGNF